MYELHESGINILDDKLGGFFDSSTYLVTGGSGTGKSILGMQFLLKGVSLMENGLLLTDEKPKDVMLQAQSLGFDLKNALINNNLLILETSEIYPTLVHSMADFKEMYEELDNYISENNIKRIVIDGFKSIFVPNNDIILAKDYLPFLFDRLSSQGMISLITADITNYQYSDEAKVLLEKLASGIIHLRQDQSKSVRHMIIRKMKSQSIELKPFDYSFVKNKGIVAKEQND